MTIQEAKNLLSQLNYIQPNVTVELIIITNTLNFSKQSNNIETNQQILFRPPKVI